MTPVRDYLAEIHRNRTVGAGAPEMALYPALQTLLNTIGAGRKPKVFCIHQLADAGAGRPDYGLYTAAQIPARGMGVVPPGTMPERGVIEAKAPQIPLETVVNSEQVVRFFERYGLVLVTNFREFRVLGRDQFGRRVELERFALAPDDGAFRGICAHPGRLSKDMAGRFVEFLTRTLMHNAVLSQPRDVAWMLASYARDALARLEHAAEQAAIPLAATYGPAQLSLVQKTLEEALGIRFEGPKGRHFFHSTLVQTLFYGLFSAWVLWCREAPGEEERRGFTAFNAAWHLRLPVLRGLFSQINTPNATETLGLVQVLDWAARALNRVDDRAFFARFHEDKAVQYFYEPFLEAFDPDLRRQLGVWYTPPEVVDYMVERVDRALRSELGIARGLADPRVIVLDPCCGTGSYLVAVLRRIQRTLLEMGEGDLAGAQVKEAALERVHGFEIMPAPFVVAHLQLSLLLAAMGAPLADGGSHTAQVAEWPSVKLTNALNGWEDDPDDYNYQPFLIAEVMNDRDAAARIKYGQEILVILGNPPYNGFPGVAESKEEKALTDAYRNVRAVAKPDGRGLNDLYVRFYRIAERRISERTGYGIVSFITNYSWLSGSSYNGMRETLLHEFDAIWIDNLNGDKRLTGKVTPDGKPDPSIFSSKSNPEGIQVGTAISLLVRKREHVPATTVAYTDFWGSEKRQELQRLTDGESGREYVAVEPRISLGLRFVPGKVKQDYESWPKLDDLFLEYFPGIFTARDGFVVDIDHEILKSRIEEYFDSGKSDDVISEILPEAMRKTSRFQPNESRKYLVKRGIKNDKFMEYLYRPMDRRYIYLEPETSLIDRKREDYTPNIFPENCWIITSQQLRRESCKPQFSKFLGSLHLMERGASFFPKYITGRRENEVSPQMGFTKKLNFSSISTNYIQTVVGLEDLEIGADGIFYHVMSILHSPIYEEENGDSVRQNWPRIPLPSTAAALEQSADLGRRVAALLDAETDVPGVTEGPEPRLVLLGRLRNVAKERHEAAGRPPPPPATDLSVTARWGYAGQKGVCMPGPGRIEERDATEEERAALGPDALALLGDRMVDVYLNDGVCWSGVPRPVWSYTLGGYQVIKKWLSYRERVLLGRPLTVEEVRHVTGMVRRIAALLLLTPELDDNYRTIAADPWPWPAG